MLPRLFIAVGLTCLATLTFTTACSSSQRRDQNYGTDKGAGYQPEAGAFTGSNDGGESDSDGDDRDDAATPLPDHAFLDVPTAQSETGDVTESDAGVESDVTAETDASLEPDASITP
jgi:hypothetical protein